MRVLHITAEMAPLLSTGGLAEVAGALPKALHAAGHDVRVVMPCYRKIRVAARGEPRASVIVDLGGKQAYGALRESRVPGTEIPLYLVEHEGYFGREHPYGHGSHEYGDNAERFCFFCLALLDGIGQLGWTPDVIHCHDWHTAAAPVYLQSRLKTDRAWGGRPSVFTIHNLAYQGRFGRDQLAYTGLPPNLFHPGALEYFGDLNLMKGAIVYAQKLTTVSPRYAREIQTPDYGAGLDGVLRQRSGDLHGILNGIDYAIWNPATDPHIAANYSAEEMSGKAECKRELQAAFGLPVTDAPVFGLVSRLFWQKGVDVVVEALDQLLALNIQLVVLGTGDAGLENRLLAAAQTHPNQVGVALRFDAALSHKIQAGSDFFLMPSRYEPCGLTQMHSLAYGTVPIVRRTGGLADSVVNLSRVTERDGTATGLSFVPMSAEALVRNVERALKLYRNATLLERMRRTGMAADFSWARASEAYVAVYRKALAA